MSKNKKRDNVDVGLTTNNEFEHVNNQFVLPVVNHMDEVALFSDDDLYHRIDVLERERSKVIYGGLDATPWEVEVSYLRREVQIRAERYALHERYLETVPRDEEYESNFDA